MIKSSIPRDVHDRTNRAGPRIGCCKNQAFETSVDNSASTHGAGLKRDIQSAIEQAPSLQMRRRRPNRQYLGMGQRIMVRLAQIVRSRNDHTTTNNNRPDRNLSLFSRGPSFDKREGHVALVVHEDPGLFVSVSWGVAPDWET